MWISKTDYEETGPNVVHKKCIWLQIYNIIFTLNVFINSFNIKQILHDKIR